MSKLRCPKCGNPLRIQKRSVNENKIAIRIECTNCGYYSEIIAKTKEKVAPKEDTKEAIELPNIQEVDPKAPEAIKIILDEIKNNELYRMVYYDHLYNEPPELGIKVNVENFVKLGFDKDFATRIVNALNSRGIKRLYKYQEEAIRNILRGKNIIIVAQTAMGKTEAFLIPSLYIAKFSEEKPSVIIIYPTKALARDQFWKIKYYGGFVGVEVDVLDGDTPWSKRRKIISNPPHILLTNFDMIHYWLPRIKKSRDKGLSQLFLNARIVIIDEVHEYYGAFGTHVHYILKRLSRLSRNAIQFVLASATILNPQEFAKLLIGQKAKLVEGKGRRVSLYVGFIYTFEPPFKAIARLLATLVANNIKTLAFLNTRSSAELALNVIRRFRNKFLSEKISLHRAGIPAKIREAIEESFRKGEILGLISTPTLELGVDIGDVQAVISELVPADRFIQRGGRAGRRGESGTAILILRMDDPISEYYARNPKEFFNDISARYLEPGNVLIAKRHIYLMAYEKKLSDEECNNLPKMALSELINEGALIRIKDGWIANGLVFNKYFTRNIRGIDDQIEIYYNQKLIDRREILIGIKELYPGGIYLNRGTKYIVERLDLKERKAYLRRAPPEYEFYYTKPLYTYSAVPLGALQKREACGTIVFHGPLKMKISVFGYALFREGERKPLTLQYLDEPIEYEYPTYGMFFKAPTYESKIEEEVAGAYHATEHILIEGTYRISGGSEYDLGGISYGTSGIIVIHEALPGGNGVSRLLFERFEDAVKKAYELLKSPICLRREYLNKCVFSYHCGNNNRPLNQRGAREILEKMLKGHKVDGAEDAPKMLLAFEKGIV